MMDNNRGGSDELDIQALLDKYLPEEDADNSEIPNIQEAQTADFAEERNDSTEKSLTDAEQITEDESASYEHENAFAVSEEKEHIKSENTAEQETVSDSNGATVFDTDENDRFFMDEEKPYTENNGEFEFEDNVFGDVDINAPFNGPENVAGGKGVSKEFNLENDLFVQGDDGEFAIDEDIIAELMANDDVQFRGIEGFEDIEELSGYDAAASDAESEPLSQEIPADSPAEDENAANDDSEEFETADEDEDEYSKFVRESLSDLDSDETGDTDLNLLVAFGLEDRLEDKVGENKAKRMKKNYNKELEAQQEKEKRSVHNEYKSSSQTREVSEGYKKRYFSLKIKLAVAAVMTFLLLIYENLPVIGYQLAGFLDPAVYPVVYVMIDLQILLIAYAAAYEQFFAGFASLFKGKPTPESIFSTVSVASLVYSIMVAKTAVPPTEPVLFNFPAALCALMALVFAYLTTKREIFSFNVISSKKPKYALRRLSANEATMEVAAFSDDEEEIGDVLKIEKVSFVDGYFYRTESSNKSNSAIIFMCLLVSLALSLLFGGYASMMNAGVTTAVSYGYSAFVASVPISVFFTYAYPFYKANLDSYESDSTIVGENSLEEYSGASIMSFDDKLVFPSVGVKVQHIDVYNNYRFDRVLYYAASVFTKTGGPLSDVFEIATLEMGYSEDVLLTGIGDGYIQTEVNGKSIVFGKAESLIELGYDIPEAFLDHEENPDVSVMFMIFKGKVVAKMIIVYELDSDFEYTVKQLAGSGMSVCVKTLDPNINEDMIKKKVSLDKYPMRVIRYASLDEIASEVERTDSGIVARGTSKPLLQTVTYCDKVLDAKRTNSFIGIFSAIITVGIFAVVLLTGNMPSFRSLYAAVCQLFWLIPMAITTKILVR